MNSKGSPFFIFRHYATFLDRKKVRTFFEKIFVPSRGKSDFPGMSSMKGHFGCLETVFQAFHEYVLGIFKKFWAFSALDIAPTSDVLVLLVFRLEDC